MGIPTAIKRLDLPLCPKGRRGRLWACPDLGNQGIASIAAGLRSLGKQCGCSKPVGAVPAGA